MYSIRFQPALNLLDIAWTGVFTPQEVSDYAKDCLARFIDEGFAAGYLLCIDVRNSTVQPRETLASFEESFRDFPKASRIAVITSSALYRLQILRIMTQPSPRLRHARSCPDVAIGKYSA
jgi:hypothetical protein